MKNFSEIFPNLIHITCVAHAVHRVCEKIREEYHLVNSLVSLMKKVLLKSNEKKHIYKQITSLPLPPSTILTRWGTFINAAVFYLDNWEKIIAFVDNIENDTKASKDLKLLIKDKNLQNDLLRFQNYRDLPKKIKELEFELDSQLSILIEIENSLTGFAAEKFKNCLTKNTGLSKIRSNKLDLDIRLKLFHPLLVSVSVERSFSQLKNLVTDRRHGFTFENLEKMLIIRYNSFL